MNTTALLKSLNQVAQFSRGEIKLKTTVVVPPLVDVKKLRGQIGLTQEQFAERYGFSKAAIRNWEQGQRVPEGPARTLLALIERNPKLIERELRQLQTA